MALTLTWLGHASFRLDGSAVVYIDPWKLADQPRGQVIVVSHSHYDHLSSDDVRALAGPGTQIVAPPDCADPLEGLNVNTANPGDVLTFGPVTVEAVPAYNTYDEKQQFHPRKNNWIGAVIAMDDRRIYYAGDTDAIPEMERLEGIDLALLPVGGTYTMNATDAVDAVAKIRPARALPYHWGDIVGDAADAQSFANAAACEVTILQPGESTTV